MGYFHQLQSCPGSAAPTVVHSLFPHQAPLQLPSTEILLFVPKTTHLKATKLQYRKTIRAYKWFHIKKEHGNHDQGQQ